MTSKEIFDYMLSIGIVCQGTITDSTYALPTRDWFLRSNASAFKTNLDLLGASAYVPEKNDCDDFSILGAVLARLAHNASSAMEAGLAVGFLFYQIDGGKGAHAIQFALVREGGQHKIIFMEPQTQKEVFLSATEIMSVFFYYL